MTDIFIIKLLAFSICFLYGIWMQMRSILQLFNLSKVRTLSGSFTHASRMYICTYGAQARNTKNRCLDILIDSFFVLQVVGTIVAYQAGDKQERAKASIPAIGFNKPIDQLSDCCRGESWAMLERVTQLTRTRSIVECGKGG